MRPGFCIKTAVGVTQCTPRGQFSATLFQLLLQLLMHGGFSVLHDSNVDTQTSKHEHWQAGSREEGDQRRRAAVGLLSKRSSTCTRQPGSCSCRRVSTVGEDGSTATYVLLHWLQVGLPQWASTGTATVYTGGCMVSVAHVERTGWLLTANIFA